MKLRIDEWINGVHYYTRCNKYGTWEVMEDIAEELPSKAVFTGTYEECKKWVCIKYAESVAPF